MNDYYVYIHFTKDTLEPFYIGKGKDIRHLSKSNRNLHWLNKVNKHNFISVIEQSDLAEEEAFDLEIDLIQRYRQKGFKLVNITDGGPGYKGSKSYVRKGIKPFRVYKASPVETHGRQEYIYEIGAYIGEWTSQKQCAEDLGISKTGVSACLRKENKSCGGFLFENFS